MSNSGDELLNRLRAEAKLKAEIIKALRGERERASDMAREQAALMAAVSADIHDEILTLGLLLQERNLGATQSAAERLAALGADLADYTAASGGQLMLARESVHLRQLLSRLDGQPAMALEVAANVPERVVADPNRLSKLLSSFVDEGLEAADAGSLLLEVTCTCPDDGRLQQIHMTLRHDAAEHGRASGASAFAPSPRRQLRAALSRVLCELMGATWTGMSISLPLESATDPAHTGFIRLAMSEHVANDSMPELSSPPAAPSEPDNWHEAGTAVDLMYLDRQLGSLAPVVLGRTAPVFIAQAQRRMSDLHVAHETEDLKRLHTIAYAWKGSALSVGARGLALQLEAIEKQAALGRFPGPGPIWQVRRTLERVLKHLESCGAARGGSLERA